MHAEVKGRWDACLLREAFSVCAFLLPGGNAEIVFGGKELKHFNCLLPQGVFSQTA